MNPHVCIGQSLWGKMFCIEGKIMSIPIPLPPEIQPTNEKLQHA